jgi:hypothetical protein
VPGDQTESLHFLDKKFAVNINHTLPHHIFSPLLPAEKLLFLTFTSISKRVATTSAIKTLLNCLSAWKHLLAFSDSSRRLH